MENIGPALIALAILAIGLALIAWRERRRSRIRFVVVNREDGWMCTDLGETPERRGGSSHRARTGARCARFTSISDSAAPASASPRSEGSDDREITSHVDLEPRA